jgi:hypothetical protein
VVIVFLSMIAARRCLSVPRQRTSGRWLRAPCEASAGFKSDLTDFYQCLVRLPGWRATEWFRMSDPDGPTPHDKAFDRDTQGLILRIIVVAFLAALFWHTVTAAGML